MIFDRKKNKRVFKGIRSSGIPILILDETWIKAFPDNIKTDYMKKLELQIVELLKEQGRINDRYNEMAALKKSKLSEILKLSAQIEGPNKNSATEAMSKIQAVIEKINYDMDSMREKLSGLPSKIENTNEMLFQECVKISYNSISNLMKKINKSEQYVSKLREELREKTEELDKLEKEYNSSSTFLKQYIGDDGIKILDSEYKGIIK